MNHPFHLLAAICFFLLSLTLAAQTDTSTGAMALEKPNIIKLNVPALVFKKVALQYERVLNKKFGVALSINWMPNTGVPFKSILLNATDDSKAEKTINEMTLNNFALTPEFRIYLGKGYGKGFYIAPFYRFTTYKVTLFPITYDRDQLSGGGENTVDLAGTITAHTGGIMIGAQWYLSKRISLDWWIIGPHYGGSSGNFTGTTKNLPFTPDEQKDISETVNDIDLPLIDQSVSFSPDNRVAIVDVSGPWGGIRAGLCIGVRL